MIDLLITREDHELILVPQTERAKRFCEWYMTDAARKGDRYVVKRSSGKSFEDHGDLALHYAKQAGLTLAWKPNCEAPDRTR